MIKEKFDSWDYHRPSCSDFWKKIFSRNGYKWHLFSDCKQTKCFFFKNSSQNMRLYSVSRTGPEEMLKF